MYVDGIIITKSCFCHEKLLYTAPSAPKKDKLDYTGTGIYTDKKLGFL
jgi:hypothetical protein